MTFDFQPNLHGELLRLRPLQPEDYDTVFALASDPLIWEQHPAWDRYKPEVFARLFKESLASEGCLVAIDLSDGKVIGWSRFHGYDEQKSEIEIGWSFLARAYWGGKYNGEMKRLMLAHAFRFVTGVIFVIGVHNLRSQKAIEKLGAVRVGKKQDAGGAESVVYRIASDFRTWSQPMLSLE